MPVAKALNDIALGHGRVWMVARDEGVVLRLDPVDRDLQAVMLVGAPVAVEPTDDGLLVLSLDDGALYALDRRGTPSPIDFSAPVRSPIGMALLGDELWALGLQDKGLVPFNVRLRRVVRDGIRLPLRSVADVAAAAGAVWVADPAGRSLARIDAGSQTVETIAAPSPLRPSGLALGPCGWALDADGDVARFDPRTRHFVGTPVAVARSGGEIEAVGDGAWMTDPVGGTLIHLVPTS